MPQKLAMSTSAYWGKMVKDTFSMFILLRKMINNPPEGVGVGKEVNTSGFVTLSSLKKQCGYGDVSIH